MLHKKFERAKPKWILSIIILHFRLPRFRQKSCVCTERVTIAELEIIEYQNDYAFNLNAI